MMIYPKVTIRESQLNWFSKYEMGGLIKSRVCQIVARRDNCKKY